MQLNGFQGASPYGRQQAGLFGPQGPYGQYGQDPMSELVVQLQMQVLMQLFMQQALQMLAQMLFAGANGGGGAPSMGCGCGPGGGRGRGLGGGPGGVPGGVGPQPGNFPAMNGPASGAGLRALQAAQSQVGVREATGNNDGVPAQRYSNGRREPWCANFVAWSFQQAGTPLPGNQRSLASVQYMEDQMKRTGQFHRGTPQPGDIIFFANRGASDRGGGRHVGIVERVENGRVHTVEGNSSNAVRRRSYSLNDPRISGYGRVGGGSAPANTPGVDPSASLAATRGADPNTAARLDRVLGGAFAGQGAAFAAAAQRHGIDPNLLAAIAMHETGNGTSRAVRQNNNPGGLMDPRTNWSTLQRFGSLEAGIDAMARNLKRNYIDKGLTTIPQIQQKYAPVGAANDPRGLNGHWQAGVTRFLNQILGRA